MALTDRIRNFFYAITHADQLITEKENLKESLDQAESKIMVASEENSNLEERLEEQTHALKRWKNMFAQALPAQLAPGQAKVLYEEIAGQEDPDGFSLLRAAEGTWGKFPYGYYCREDWIGTFEKEDGGLDYNTMMEYFVSYLKEAYPSFPEYEDVMYVNAMVRMGILGQERQMQINPDPLQKLTQEELNMPGRAKVIYEKYQLRLDPDGSTLFAFAQDILGDFNQDGWPYENSTGTFEVINGQETLQYLLIDNVHRFGEANMKIDRWRVVPNSHCERCINFSIEQTPEYEAFESELYRKVCSHLGLVETQELVQPEQGVSEIDWDNNRTEDLGTPPVGRIDYLGLNGKVREQIEYCNEADFIAAIKQDNYCGVPMSITIYSDPVTGKHIDTTCVKELDPPPQGFQIEPCPVSQEQLLPVLESEGPDYEP